MEQTIVELIQKALPLAQVNFSTDSSGLTTYTIVQDGISSAVKVGRDGHILKSPKYVSQHVISQSLKQIMIVKAEQEKEVAAKIQQAKSEAAAKALAKKQEASAIV